MIIATKARADKYHRMIQMDQRYFDLVFDLVQKSYLNVGICQLLWGYKPFYKGIKGSAKEDGKSPYIVKKG